MPICPVTKKCKFIGHSKKLPPSTAIFRPFGPGRQNFNTRFYVGLHKPVKFYPDALRFAGVIREKHIKLSCICMTAYNQVLHCQLNLAFSAICKVTTSKFTAKLFLLSHSENYRPIKLTFVVVSHKIFLVRLFCAPLPAAPGGNCPLCPPSVTPLYLCQNTRMFGKQVTTANVGQCPT